MSKKSFFSGITAVSVFFIFFTTGICDTDSAAVSSLHKLIENGDTDKAEDLCGDIVFSSENPADAGYANVAISILLFLEMDGNAASRSASMCDFYVDSDNPDEQKSALILTYLAGRISGKQLTEKLKDADNDRKATAAIAQYVRTLAKYGVVPAELNKHIKTYISLIKDAPADSWGGIWKERIILWHNALQDKTGSYEDLEPLIAKKREDALKGPIRKQLIAVNNIIKQLLANKKASYLIPPKTPVTKEFTALLNFLKGKNKSLQTVYAATRDVPELSLMTAVAAFVKTLSDSPDGKLNKEILIVHLDNFLNNIQNSDEKLVQEWVPTVKRWQMWCKNDFPISPKLEPLLLKHSKAIEQIKRKEQAMAEALKIYKTMMDTPIQRVSLSDFKKERILFSNRPQFTSFDFSNGQAIQAYLKTLPAEVQQGEWGRARWLKTFKSNMINILGFSQYSGTILFTSGSPRHGKVMKADDNYITIKTSSGTRKYKWSSLKPRQYIAFTSYYIKNNIGGKVHGRNNIFVTKEATDKALCKEYRLLALFCDWYGCYSDALKYAKKAASYKSDAGAMQKLLLQ